MLTSLVPRDLLSDYHFLALPCTQCVPADICQRHPLPSGFSGCPGGSARPSSAHLKWPISHHPSNGVEHRVPAAAWAFLRFLDIAAVASTWVSIPVYANTSIINVCSPPRVGIHRHSPAGAPGGVVRFLYDDPCQAGPLDSRVWTLCSSPAQFEAASPFRPIAGEAELECFLSNKLRLLVPAATERICLDRGFGCRRGVNALSCFCLYTRYPHHTRAYGWSLCRPGGS